MGSDGDKDYIETEFQMLWRLLKVPYTDRLTHVDAFKQAVYQNLKLGQLDDLQIMYSKEYLSLVQDLEAIEILDGVDLSASKVRFLSEVNDHAITSVGAGGFGFRMARSQFAETKQHILRRDDYSGSGNMSGDDNKGDGFDFSNIPKPNPKYFKSQGVNTGAYKMKGFK